MNHPSLKRWSRTFCVTLFLLLFASPSVRAAAYWIELTGNGKVESPVTLSICYGSMDDFGVRHRDTGKELLLIGEFRLHIIDNQGAEEVLPLSRQKDCWTATFTPHLNGCYRILAVNDTHPVVDRSASGGENVRPIDFICAAYIAGHGLMTDSLPRQTLDIVSSVWEKFVSVQVFNNGKTASKGSKIRVFNPDNWEKELVVDDQGKARFFPPRKGLYIIRYDMVKPGWGTYLGVNYKSTRYRCNYFFFTNLQPSLK